MHKYFVFLLTLFILGAISSQSALFSQEIQDPEAEYSRIKSMAFEGEYDSAVVAARRLVRSYPSYGDARVLLGRIMAWQNDYVNAIAVLDTLLKTEPANSDALSAKSDILLWARENTKVSTDLRTGYSFDSFTEPYNRSYQLYRVGAGHRFKFGPAAASFNVGNLVSGNPLASNGTEFQIEVEAYPKLGKRNYAFLNYAYSPGEFLPGHRAIAELWQLLPAGWGVSAGVNYYYFDRSSYIATASVEKYLGDFWMSLKGFFYFKDEATTTSAYFNIRSYFTDNDYLQITLGAGTAPDEPFEIQADLMRYLAYSARAAFNVSLAPKMVMRIGAGYSIEEYAEESWRNRFEGGISFIYAIKMK